MKLSLLLGPLVVGRGDHTPHLLETGALRGHQSFDLLCSGLHSYGAGVQCQRLHRAMLPTELECSLCAWRGDLWKGNLA